MSDATTEPRPMKMLCIAKPVVRWPSGSRSVTKARKGSMETLLEASSSQRKAAAAQMDGAFGISKSISRGNDGAGEEVGPTPAEACPGAVAGLADERLDEQAGERGGEPQDGNLVRRCAEILIDGAHVGELQRPAKLDAQEAEVHVPDLRERLPGLLHRVPY